MARQRRFKDLRILSPPSSLCSTNPTPAMASSTSTTTATATSSSNGSHVGTLHLSAADTSLDGHDEEQIRLMEERCIVISPEDEVVRDGSKKECHLMTNINKGLLHRAFSVFLFDPTSGKLLLQRRAPEKITFPNMWTNTCCSHPLSVRAELEEAEQIGEHIERSLILSKCW